MGPMWSVFARCSAWVEETGESFCGESLKNMNSRRLTTRNRLWQSRGGFISLKIFSRGWKKVARLQGLGGLNTLESAALLVVIVTCWTKALITLDSTTISASGIVSFWRTYSLLLKSISSFLKEIPFKSLFLSSKSSSKQHETKFTSVLKAINRHDISGTDRCSMLRL